MELPKQLNIKTNRYNIISTKYETKKTFLTVIASLSLHDLTNLIQNQRKTPDPSEFQSITFKSYLKYKRAVLALPEKCENYCTNNLLSENSIFRSFKMRDV